MQLSRRVKLRLHLEYTQVFWTDFSPSKCQIERHFNNNQSEFCRFVNGSNEVQTEIFNLFRHENYYGTKMINVVKSMSLIRITFRIQRDFRQISENSVYQNVKANGKQQLRSRVPVQTPSFSVCFRRKTFSKAK